VDSDDFMRHFKVTPHAVKLTDFVIWNLGGSEVSCVGKSDYAF
jgi:hypothetical protein